MDIEGIVVSVLQPVSGTSARGQWTKQEVILEQPKEFSRKVCVSFWGDKAMDAASLKPGDKVTVSIGIESREHNGRWFTEARAWKLVKESAAPEAPMYGAGAPQPAADMPYSDPGRLSSEEEFDDLPF